ncbi:MAG: FixH family protein [Pseudomonadota bacterium]
MSKTMALPEETVQQRELKGWHVLLIMMAFFGVMFAVNGVFLYHAITSFPGEDVKKSYVQGLNYNQTLAARAAQTERGWQAEAGLQENSLVFRLSDADGQPVSNQMVIGELRRLATDAEDQAVVFRAGPAGEYIADLGAPTPGRWSVRIYVMDAASDAVMFTASKTLIVP